MSESVEMAAARRRAHRVLATVGELHKMGYQRLRVVPGVSGSGLHWRVALTDVDNLCGTGGMELIDLDRGAFYTTAQENEYFGWRDVKTLRPPDLAKLFEERFPALTSAGEGDDWAYAGWYVKLLGFTAQGYFPIAYSDWSDPLTDHLPVVTFDGADPTDRLLPLPPFEGAADPSEDRRR